MKRIKIKSTPKKRTSWDSIVKGTPVGEGWEDVEMNQYLSIYRAMKKFGYEVQRQKVGENKYRVWRYK